MIKITIIFICLLASCEARAQSVCAEDLGSEKAQAAYYKGLILRRSDQASFKMASSLEIRFEDDQDTFGPSSAMENGHGVIIIPRGFTETYCKIALISMLAEEPDAVSMTDFTNSAVGCLNTNRGLQYCLNFAISKFGTRLSTSYQRYRSVRGDVVDDAAIESIWFLIEHEFAHLYLGHFSRSANDEDSAQQEFDADLFAANSSIISSGQLVIAFQPFNTLARISQRWNHFSSSHDSFLCRSENLLDMATYIGLILPATVASTRYPDLGRQSDPRRVAASRRAALREIAQLPNMKPGEAVLRAQKLPRCHSVDGTRLTQIRNDFLEIARIQNRVIDTLPSPVDDQGIVNLLAQLVALPIKTAEGRQAQISIIDQSISLYDFDRKSKYYTVNVEAMLDPFIRPNGRLENTVEISVYVLLRKLADAEGWIYRAEDERSDISLLSAATDLFGSDPRFYQGMIRSHYLAGNCQAASAVYRIVFLEDARYVQEVRIKTDLVNELDTRKNSGGFGALMIH